MKTLYSSFPVVTCPHCERHFQIDDYYDLEVGDSFTCVHCENEIYIHDMDTVIECMLGTNRRDK